MITEQDIASWIASGIVRLAEPDEIKDVTINPLHAVNCTEADRNLGKKPRFIIHTKLNSVCKTLPTRLEGIGTALHRITGMKSGVVLDAKKAFMQIRISPESERLCGFKIFGKVFVARVLTFGNSMGTHICDTLLKVPIYSSFRKYFSLISIFPMLYLAYLLKFFDPHSLILKPVFTISAQRTSTLSRSITWMIASLRKASKANGDKWWHGAVSPSTSPKGTQVQAWYFLEYFSTLSLRRLEYQTRLSRNCLPPSASKQNSAITLNAPIYRLFAAVLSTCPCYN